MKSLEYYLENLEGGYYLVRGIVKSERPICDAKIILEFPQGNEVHKLPINRSGRINFILKLRKKAKKVTVLIPLTPNSVIERGVSFKKLSFLESFYYFYRRIFGVFFSKNPATVHLRLQIKTNLLKALIKPEETYYKISREMRRRICDLNDYREWLMEYEKQKEGIYVKESDISKPSLLVILFLEDQEHLSASVASIKNQVVPPERVVVCSKKNLMSLLNNSKEDYVLFLEKGDILDKFAVYCFKKFARGKNLPDIIYSDHHYSGNKDPRFKPDWSPDYFFEYDYIKAPVFYRRERLNLEKFTSNYGVILDILKNKPNATIEHIPELLLTRFEDDERYEQKLEELREYFGEDVQVYPSEDHHTFRTVHILKSFPKVSIVIPTKDKPELIGKCVNSILEKTDYPDYEILILDNGSSNEQVFKLYEEWKKDERIKIYSINIPFNFSKLVNFGVSKAEGEVVCLLNNDTEIIEKNWLKEMVRHAQRKEVGVVGAKLLYPDGTIQHGGVIMGIWNGTDHAFKGVEDGEGYMYRLSTVQNYLVVTGACMVFRKEVFYEVGGFDEEFEIDFNDVDFCLKVYEKGYRIVWTPYARLIHFESKSKRENWDEERAERERVLLRRRWSKYILHDPYYNKNLTLYDTNFGLSMFPKFYCLE
ncbi:glycosyltransferase family 2 protein [Thermocrinis sp.]